MTSFVQAAQRAAKMKAVCVWDGDEEQKAKKESESKRTCWFRKMKQISFCQKKKNGSSWSLDSKLMMTVCICKQYSTHNFTEQSLKTGAYHLEELWKKNVASILTHGVGEQCYLSCFQCFCVGLVRRCQPCPHRAPQRVGSSLCKRVPWENLRCNVNASAEYTLRPPARVTVWALVAWKQSWVVYVCVNAGQNEGGGLGGSAIICNGNSLTWDARSFTSHLTRWSTCQPGQCSEQRELSSYNVTKQVWKKKLSTHQATSSLLVLNRTKTLVITVMLFALLYNKKLLSVSLFCSSRQQRLVDNSNLPDPLIKSAVTVHRLCLCFLGGFCSKMKPNMMFAQFAVLHYLPQLNLMSLSTQRCFCLPLHHSGVWLSLQWRQKAVFVQLRKEGKVSPCLSSLNRRRQCLGTGEISLAWTSKSWSNM